MSKIENLKKIKHLLDEGLISNAEFEKLKFDIMVESDSSITETNDFPIKNGTISDFKAVNANSEKNVVSQTNENSNYKTYGIIGLIFMIGFFVWYNFSNGNETNNLGEVPIGQEIVDSTKIDMMGKKDDSLINAKIDSIAKNDAVLPNNDVPIPNNDTLMSKNDSKEITNSYTYTPVKKMNNDEVIDSKNVDVKPNFPGGMDKFYSFVAKNFNMPEEKGINGKLRITFIVEKDGSLTDIKVLNDIGYGTRDEAIRVLKKCPKWSPGEQNGETVRVLYSLPITIQSE
jgi:hypothetical protein